MLVAMMSVRIMGVLVSHGFVPVRMSMRSLWHNLVLMCVMGIVNVGMGVFYRLVGVFVLMNLRQMQPDSERH